MIEHNNGSNALPPDKIDTPAVTRRAPLVLDKRLAGLRGPSVTGEDDLLRLLLYGTPGVGKTVFSASASDDERSSPVLFIDTEGGMLSVSHKPLATYEIRNYAEDWPPLRSYLIDANAKGDLPYKTVVVDSLSILAERLMNSITAKSGHYDKPDWDDWNIWTNHLRRAIATLRDLNVHLIVTALEYTEKDVAGPMLPGRKLGPVLPGAFNIVGRLFNDIVPSEDKRSTVQRRRLLLTNTPNAVAKDRSNRLSTLPPVVDNPTVSALLDRLDEGRRQAQALALNGHNAKE